MGGAELQTDREGGLEWLEYLDEHHHGYVTIDVSPMSLVLNYYHNNDPIVYDIVKMTK